MKLKDLRKNINQSQSTVAQALGIPRTTYINYENGVAEMDYSMLIRVAEYFNVSIDDLLDRANTEHKYTKLKLYELRKSKNLLQKDVADALGITFQTYSSYEIGNSKPTPEMLCKLADFFGVTIDELLGRTAAPGIFDDARIQKSEIQELYDRMTSNEQAFLLSAARGIVNKQ